MDKLDNGRLIPFGSFDLRQGERLFVCSVTHARDSIRDRKNEHVCAYQTRWRWRRKHLLLITCSVHFQLSAKLRVRKTIRNQFFHFIGFVFIGKNKWYTDYYATQSQVGTVGIYSLVWLCDCLPSTSNKTRNTHTHKEGVVSLSNLDAIMKLQVSDAAKLVFLDFWKYYYCKDPL